MAYSELDRFGTAQQLADAFIDFQGKLPLIPVVTNYVFGYVNPQRLNELVVSPPGPVVESPGETLSDEPLRTVLTAADRCVPITTTGRLNGLTDRDAVALAVAWAALARTAAT